MAAGLEREARRLGAFRDPSLEAMIPRSSRWDLAWALAEAEAPHAAAIETAIDGWIALGGDAEWDIGEEPRRFLSLRFETAFAFLCRMCHTGDHPETSLAGYPADMAPLEAARYFLVDWWATHGRDAAAEELILAWHDDLTTGCGPGSAAAG